MLGWLKRRNTDSPSPVAAEATGHRASELRSEGNAWLDRGDLGKAESCYRRAVAADAADALALINLAHVLNEQRRYPEALLHSARATLLDPDSMDAFYVLASAQVQVSDLPGTATSLRRLLQIRPDFEPAYSMLCRVLAEQGLIDQAREVIHRGLLINNRSAEFHCHLGNVEFAAGNLDAAACSHRQAIALNPNAAAFHSDLGMALHGTAALACYREALRLDPRFSVAHSNIGISLYEQGDIRGAADSFRAAISLEPERVDFRSKLLFVSCFDESCSPAQYRADAEAFGELASRLAMPFDDWPIASARNVSMPLRVGLVSGDLRYHPVGHFVEAMISYLPAQGIELIAYSTVAHQDDLTARIRPCFARWRSLVGLSDSDAAQKIRNDGVQVLIDLAGHTANNRLPVFAWRPAPVQVSWLGYFASTGLRAIDYVLADARCLPEEDENQFIEEVWRLPKTRYCFTPPAAAPAVTALPALTAGYLTFGSFQNLAKVSEPTVDEWSSVLRALPTARFRIQSPQLAHAFERERLLARFAARGVSVGRLDLYPAAPREAYLAAHRQVDVLLDTFPFTGGTTTCEALWMGVPTVTKEGHTMLSRQGAALMRTIGLGEWVAKDARRLVETVVERVTDLPRLATLRRTLREHVLSSPLYDAPRFAADLASTLRRLAYCDRDNA